MWKRIRGWVPYIWSFYKFLFNVMCVALAAGVTVALVFLLQFPAVAAREKVDVLDLVLRALEDGGQHRPVDILSRRNPLGPDLAEFDKYTGTYDIQAIYTSRTGPFAFKHDVKSAKASSQAASDVVSTSVTSTTPNLQTKVEDLKKGAALMRAVFPDAATRAEVVKWGQSLIAAAQATKYGDKLPPEVSPLAKPSIVASEETETEALYAAAVVFRGHQPNAEKDLPRLVELGRAAFPDEATAAAARKWAVTLLDRWDEVFAKFKKDNASSPTAKEKAAMAVPSVTPPRSEWAEWWVVYQFVGLDDASREAALKRWKGMFPPESRHAETEAFGKAQLEARAAAGEPVPPGPVAPWVALVEYYRGWDARGARVRALYGADAPLPQVGPFILAAYPGDDLYMISSANDPLNLVAPDSNGNGFFLIVALALMLARGYRILILDLIGKRLLKLRDNKLFQEYTEGRAEGRWWVRWLVIVVVGVAAWQLTLAKLAPPLSPVAGTDFDILMACIVATAFGGAVFTAFTRFAAVVLIKRRVDVNRVWLDEVIGLAAAALVLSYFGNDWGMIGLYAMTEVVTALIAHRSRKHETPTAE